MTLYLLPGSDLPEVGPNSAIPEEYHERIRDILVGETPIGVNIGYVYDRKGYITVDGVRGARNQSYGSKDDTILVQVAYQIPASTPQRERVEEVIRDYGDVLRQQEIERADDEVARAERNLVNARSRRRALGEDS